MVVRFHRDGIDGSTTTYKNTNGFRDIEVTGPFTVQYGKFGDDEWHTNTNGQTVLDQPDPGKAAQDAYTEKLTRVSRPFDAYVISRMTKRGTGTRDYIDPATYRIVRHEHVYAAETDITTYDQFVKVGDYTRAWHWKTDDGTPADAGDYKITTLENGSVGNDDIAIPANHRLVQFPAGAKSVDVPASVHDGKFIVRVTIAGRGLDFELDTGAAGIVMDDDVARSLGLKSIVNEKNSANAGSYTEGTVIVPSMNVGPLTMTNVAVSTVPHSMEEDPGSYKVVGLLGFDFIAGTALALDYEHQKLTAYEPSSFEAPADPDQIVLPVRLGTQQPLTNVTFNGSLGERFVVDTGAANIGVTVFDYFARRYPQAIVGALYGNGGISMAGVGGDIQFVPFKARSVMVGHVNFEDYVAFKVTGNSYGGNEDGLIGPAFLKYFTVYTDYTNARLVLVPNSTGRAAMGLKKR